MWITHLVDQLLGDGTHRYPATGVGMLGHDEAAVGFRLDQRVADVGEIGDRAPVVQTVPAGALRAPLDDVSGDDSGGELVPALARPPKLMAQRRHRQRGVGRSTGDHYV